jgi:hypothetical protein
VQFPVRTHLKVLEDDIVSEDIDSKLFITYIPIEHIIIIMTIIILAINIITNNNTNRIAVECQLNLRRRSVASSMHQDITTITIIIIIIITIINCSVVLTEFIETSHLITRGSTDLICDFLACPEHAFKYTSR